MNGNLLWARDQQREIHSVAELDAFLTTLSQQVEGTMAVAVELFMDDDTGMCIVIGERVSHVSFYSKRGGPLVVKAVGTADVPLHETEDEIVAFLYCGEYSEVLRRDTVPVEVAREALRHYFLTGQRPNNIAWE